MAFYSNSLNFPNLTTKGSPVAADIILLADSAAGNAPKQATLSSLPFAPSAGASVVNITTSTQAMAINTIYYVNYTGGVCTVTIPTAGTSSQGAEIEIIGGESATNAFVVAVNASQQIRFGEQITTATTGTLTAPFATASLKLRATSLSGGLVWTVLGSVGSFAGT